MLTFGNLIDIDLIFSVYFDFNLISIGINNA